LVNDVVADLRQSIDVGFPGPKIAAFDRIVEQSPDAVAVVGIVLGCIDAPWAAMLWARRGLSWMQKVFTL
jgi:hypothetical protein